MTIRWFKDGKQLPQMGKTLTFTAKFDEYDGDYRCVATNDRFILSAEDDLVVYCGRMQLRLSIAFTNPGLVLQMPRRNCQ